MSQDQGTSMVSDKVYKKFLARMVITSGKVFLKEEMQVRDPLNQCSRLCIGYF